jgi:ketosteroid isomerase-like protein
MKIALRKKFLRILPAAPAILFLQVFLFSQTGSSASNDELLKVRERVWRAWFQGDTKTLEKLMPPGSVVISDGEEKWKNQDDVIRTSIEFHDKGGKLIRLEFPHTDVQHFGDVAVVWSSFVLETESDGRRSSSAGRATEIFVWRDGHWLNPGWHTSSTK